jgi:hypothetical protein
MNTALYRKLALLTDSEAELCLNGLLKGLTIREPTYSSVLLVPNEMLTIIREFASAAEVEAPREIIETTPENRSQAVRMLLAEIADDNDLAPRLENWIDGARPKLLEPVTVALVLAGIVLVLSTHINIEYDRKDGKSDLKVKIEKKPTDKSILGKFFNLFTPSQD